MRGNSGETAQMLKALRRNVQHLERLVGKVLEENTNLKRKSGSNWNGASLICGPSLRPSFTISIRWPETASTQLINRCPTTWSSMPTPSLLRRVFQNLIANAIKYTPRGEVIIGARELGEEGAVECWVSDNGAGIPEELLEKVFDKGETDPENAGGTGLGLAIVKTFTEAHGGQVTVESKEGVGSTFRFSLPTKANVDGLTR